MIKILKIILLVIPLVSIMVLTIRGLPGSPDAQMLQTDNWRSDGPFELSPERGRFALTYSLAEHKSVYFPVDIARFVIPDLGYKNGNYVSLFAPALSFIVLPGYLFGKLFGITQIGTFAIVSIFGIANFILIYTLSKKFGAGKVAPLMGGIVFLFASPAYSYAVNLYQHHVTTFLILLSLTILAEYKGFWSIFCLSLIYGIGVSLDYPNAFLLLPIVITAIYKTLEIEKQKKHIRLNVNLVGIAGAIGIILPILFFFWFNKTSYGNPLTTLGNPEIISVKDINENGSPTGLSAQDREAGVNTEPNKAGASSYFDTRDIVNGLYILFASPDRGIVVFAPIALLGLLGALYFKKISKINLLPTVMGIISANILVYSMWGDPWGGWAFGVRYLIPSHAMLAILTAVMLRQIGKKWLIIIPFWIALVYSLFVNTLGALTSSASPPQIEAEALSHVSGKVEKYSWDRNWEFIVSGNSKSFVFQSWGYKYLSAVQYFYIIFGSLVLVSTVLTLLLPLQKYEETKSKK